MRNSGRAHVLSRAIHVQDIISQPPQVNIQNKKALYIKKAMLLLQIRLNLNPKFLHELLCLFGLHGNLVLTVHIG